MRSSEPTMPRETVMENLLGVQRFRDETAEDNAERLLRLKRKLPAALSKLPEKQRMYLLAYYSERLTMEQLAERFGVNKSTVSRSIQRGKKKLQDYLQFCL